MQNTTADYKLEINKPSRSFECKVTIGDNIYKNEDIVDIILDYTQPQDGFSIGNTVSQTLDLTLINKGDTIYSTSQIKLEIGLKIGSTIEYIPMGIFNIDDVEKTDYTTKFTCYDNMIKFESAYFSSLGDKPTLQQVVNELASKTGVQFTGSLPSYTVSKLDGFSCREILSYVASICAGNAVITRDGKFTIKGLSEVNRAIDGNNYITYTKEEIKYKIGQISCQVNENNILSKGSLGSDSMELQFENPWINETILTDIYNKLNGLSYLGYSMKWQGDLSLDPYDVIIVTDKKGVVRKEPILSNKFTYTGGLTSEIGAKGETKNKNSFSSSGSTSNKVNRLVTEQAVIKEALIEKANISDLKATNAEIANLKAKDAEIENAIINKANITDLNAINANIQNLIAEDARITNLIATKADITDLTATNIKFNVGTGGTLDLQTLLSKFVTGENGQFLNITSSNVVIANATIKDAMIENLSLNKLKAGTISTNKFTVASDDGGITIVGPTMQFKDKSNKVRIQMGQDTQGNFNFILRGADGTTTLIDHTGIKEKAIADNLIKEKMIAADAIGEKQINYSSLITGLNKDTNTSLIKASKVAIDLTGQSLEVSFNSLKSNVDGLEIGGRNLAQKTSKEYSTPFSSFNGGTNTTAFVAHVLTDGLSVGDIVTVRLLYKYKDIVATTGQTASCWIQGNGNTTAWNTGTFNSSPRKTLSGSGEHEFLYNFTITADHLKNSQWTVSIRHDYVKSGSVQWKMFKVENGTKATDWTPAIEDTDKKIESNTTAIGVVQGKIEGLIKESSITKGDVTTLKDKYTSIKATVDGINTTVASHTSSISTIQGTANSALANANNANNKIDGLDIGGTNIIKGTNTIAQIGSVGKWTNGTWRTASGGKGTREIINISNSPNSNIKKGLRITINAVESNPSDISQDGVPVVNGITYTLSCYARKISGNPELRLQYGTNPWPVKKIPVTSTRWEKYSYTFTVGEISDGSTNGFTNIYFGLNSTKIGVIEICGFKLEKGNKATDWTPAPEDVNSVINGVAGDVSTLTGKLTTVENKQATLEQNLNGFKTTVSNTYSTKTELSNLSGTVSSINSRVSTAESSITQLNNKIDLKVESTEVNSIVNNAVNNVQVGGRNYIKNSNSVYMKPNGTNNYDLTFSICDSFWENKNRFSTVTLSFDVKSDSALAEDFSSNIWFRATPWYSFDKWTYPKGTTETKHYVLQLNLKNMTSSYKATQLFVRFQAKDTIGMKFTNVKLEIGNKATDWTPAPEDVNSAISTVDTKITTTNNKVATIETNLSSITQRVSSTESTVSSINGNVSNLTSRVNTAESKLTATSLTTTISTAINNGTSSISTTQFVMDKTGLTIKNGAIKIQNKAGTNVFASDTNGNLTITGTFINKNSNGVKAIEINNTNIYFYDWERNGRELGVIYSSYLTNYPNCRGFSIAHNSQGYLTFGYRKPDSNFGTYIILDKYSKNPNYAAPIRFLESAVFSQAVNMQNRVYVPNTIVFDDIYRSTSAKMFKAPTANRLVLEVSVNAVGDGVRIQSNTGSLLAQIRAGEHYPIHLNNNTYISGDLAVSGSKNSLQATKSYGERLINAVESAEYYYSDFGFGEINNDGECYISIDDILQECVNLDCEYHIFTQKYNGDITSIDRHRDYFIVHGEPETKFSWQYIAKRIGYENVRLDVPEIGTVEDVPVFTEEDLEVKTVEDTLLDVLTFRLEDILMEG